jgi:hypothetical protein
MLETDREVARGREEVAQSRNKLLEDQLKATHRARDNEAQKTLDAEMNRAAKTMLGRGVTGPITKQQMMEGTAAAAGVKTPEGNHAVLDATGVRKGKAAFHECVDRYLAAASEHMERDEHERVPFSEWRAGLMEEAAKYVDASGRALIEKGIVHAWSSSTDDSDRYYYVINNLLGTVADIQDKHFHA